MNAALRGLHGRRRRPRSRPSGTTIRGVIVTSAKKTFFAGGDLDDLIRRGPGDAAGGVRAQSQHVKRELRRLETLGKPVVAAINGAALGGGFEIALACHHRIALDAPGSRSACPRSPSACCPAAAASSARSGCSGIADALLKVLLQGQRHRPARPLETAWCDEVAPPRGAARPGPRLHHGQPRRRAALGRQGLPDPRRHPVEPEVRRQPARLPGQPAQAAQGRALPGAAQHPGRRRRGRPGRLRDRADHRGPVLRRAGHRPDREEHDPGVLLRPAGGQRRATGRPGQRAPCRSTRSPCSAPA